MESLLRKIFDRENFYIDMTTGIIDGTIYHFTPEEILLIAHIIGEDPEQWD